LRFDGDRCTLLLASFGGGTYEVRAKAVVSASGGFEAGQERGFHAIALDARAPRFATLRRRHRDAA
jgi:hypothetical protein